MRPMPERKYLRRLAITLCIFSLLFVTTLVTSRAQNPPREISMMITADDIVSISHPKEISRSEFDKDSWGQFQVLIPKGRFPIPAPNCKKNIILRMPGVAPDDASRSAKLDTRWDLFQSLYAVKEGKKESILVYVASGPYLKTKKDGARELEYCNAFIKTK
jgi:hypothetical protein